jgi:poly(hydroxyalkanoate) granule-associated protein
MSKKEHEDKSDVLGPIEATAREAIGYGEKVWLAGLGVLARAQSSGEQTSDTAATDGFTDLVNAGREFADRARETGESQFQTVRDTVNNAFDKAHREIKSGYDKALDQTESNVEKVAESLGIEQIFDRRVDKALQRLGYPTKKQHAALSRKVNALKKKVDQLDATL